MKNFQIHLAILSVLLFSGCSNDENQKPGTVQLEFNSILEGGTLDLLDATYNHNPGGTFIVEDFKYYLSNFMLINSAKGNSFIIQDGYFLIHKDNNYDNFKINLENIPAGQYDKIEFSVGIDPSRNLSIDNIGDLDPNNQMAWNWNIGYKFMLLEGTFTNTSGQDFPLVFHIGADINYKTYLIELPVAIDVSDANTHKIKIEVEVQEFFENPNTIDFNNSNTIKHSPEASELAENYGLGMFTITAIEEVL